MSQHPSLRSTEKSKQHRSVLKRFERLKKMKEKEEWDEEKSIFGLPKIKILKFKIKKEKAAPDEEAVAEGAEGAAPAKEGAAPKEGAKAKKEEKAPAKTAAPAKDAKGKK